MRTYILKPENNLEINTLIEFLENTKIQFEEKKSKKKSKIQPAEIPDISPMSCAGLWKDEKITLKTLREKAWSKRSKF